jgi:hypothetical protein
MKKQLQKIVLMASFAFFCLSNADAQTPTWAWATDTIPAIGGMTTDAAGNVYIAGGFGPNFLMKRDNNGNRLWAKSATGAQDSPPAVQTYPDDITLDPSGNIFVTGFFTSATMTLGTIEFIRVSTVDMYIAKFDMNGEFLWAKTEAVGNVGNVGFHVSCDGSGNAIVVGSYSAPSVTIGGTTYTNQCTSGGGCPSMLVIKYSGTDGAVLWSKSSFSGIGTSYCYSVDVDAANDIYVGGDFLSTRNGIVKYNSDGDTLWTQKNGGWYVDIDNSGNLYSGWNKSPSPSNAVVKKYNASTGAIVWTSTPTGNTNNKGAFLTHDASGNIYFSGTFRSTSITFGSYTLNHTGGTDDDIYIVKYDNTGTVLWAKSLGGTSWDAATGFAVDNVGNVFANGYFLSPTLTFDATTLNIVTALGYNIYMAKLGDNVLSVNHMDKLNNVSVYPNPATSNINITGITGKTEIKLFDLLGNVIMSTFTPTNTATEGNTSLNTSELSQGVYMLVTQNNNGKTLTKVIISK